MRNAGTEYYCRRSNRRRLTEQSATALNESLGHKRLTVNCRSFSPSSGSSVDRRNMMDGPRYPLSACRTVTGKTHNLRETFFARRRRARACRHAI